MKPKFFQLLEHAIQSGIDYGYAKANEYEELPSEYDLKAKIFDGVLNEICEWFHLEDEYAE